MKSPFELQVYKLYLDYMNLEDNDSSYKMFISDCLHLYNKTIVLYKPFEIGKIPNTNNWEIYDKNTTGVHYVLYYNNDTTYINTDFTYNLHKIKEQLVDYNNIELDLTKCKNGDKLLLRNNDIVIFDKIDTETDTEYIIDAFYENGISTNFKKEWQLS